MTCPGRGRCLSRPQPLMRKSHVQMTTWQFRCARCRARLNVWMTAKRWTDVPPCGVDCGNTYGLRSCCSASLRLWPCSHIAKKITRYHGRFESDRGAERIDGKLVSARDHSAAPPIQFSRNLQGRGAVLLSSGHRPRVNRRTRFVRRATPRVARRSDAIRPWQFMAIEAGAGSRLYVRQHTDACSAAL